MDSFHTIYRKEQYKYFLNAKQQDKENVNYFCVNIRHLQLISLRIHLLNTQILLS